MMGKFVPLLDSSVETFTIRLALDEGQPVRAGGQKMIEIHGPADLTAETTDAIVNAANSSLL
ncbi:MAG TPA: hypothetical protein VFL34_18545, partial [Candidatus Sulfotelmatobacter sp.]|nr:hypothetical protein [Candidatus Sulfotelmatobacter sp.]